MDLEKSLDQWCAHIQRITRYNPYTGKSISGFSKGAITKPYFDFIIGYLTIKLNKNDSITQENIHEIFLELFTDLNPKSIGNLTYDMIARIILGKKLFNYDLNNDNLDKLKSIISSADLEYNRQSIDDDIESQGNDPLIIKDTQDPSSAGSGSTNQSSQNGNTYMWNFLNSINDTMKCNFDEIKNKFDDIYSKLYSKSLNNSDYSNLNLSELKTILGFRINKLILHKNTLEKQNNFKINIKK